MLCLSPRANLNCRASGGGGGITGDGPVLRDSFGFALLCSVISSENSIAPLSPASSTLQLMCLFLL